MVNRVVDPLLQYIENAASRLPAIDQSAYTLNCIYQIHSSLSLYEYVDIKLESLQVNEFPGLKLSKCKVRFILLSFLI